MMEGGLYAYHPSHSKSFRNVQGKMKKKSCIHSFLGFSVLTSEGSLISPQPLLIPQHLQIEQLLPPDQPGLGDVDLLTL